ncbi:MAG: hypothetical protein ACKVG0_06985 [Alphaproteobacteria bacterium]
MRNITVIKMMIANVIETARLASRNQVGTGSSNKANMKIMASASKTSLRPLIMPRMLLSALGLVSGLVSVMRYGRLRVLP